jgi:hypothetical protein
MIIVPFNFETEKAHNLQMDLIEMQWNSVLKRKLSELRGREDKVLLQLLGNEPQFLFSNQSDLRIVVFQLYFLNMRASLLPFRNKYYNNQSMSIVCR